MRHSNDKVLLTVRTIVTKHILPSCISSGTHGLLDISSMPTVAELDEFIVQSITDGWKQVMFHLRVESFMIDILKGDNPGQLEEASRIVLSNWLNTKSGTGVTERTWRSVLKALERSWHKRLADKLKREQFGESSEDPHSELTTAGVCAAGLWRDCTCYRLKCCCLTLLEREPQAQCINEYSFIDELS